MLEHPPGTRDRLPGRGLRSVGWAWTVAFLLVVTAPGCERASPTPLTYPPGEAVLAPLSPARRRASRLPLRTYTGRSVTLRTDTDHAYATALLGKLQSFVAQANHHLARILDGRLPHIAVTIVVFQSQERYQRYARGHAPGLVNNGGYYDGSSRTVVTYRFNNSMQLYFHELVHAMMAEHFRDHHFTRYTRKGWPIWFDEGMSEYLGSYAVDGDGIRIPAPNKGKLAYLANAIAHRAFIDLPTLIRAPAGAFSGASMNIYYAESWGLVDFLLTDPAYRTKVPLFFRKIRSGEVGTAAFLTCFGKDLRGLEKRWRVHIHRAVRPPARVWLFNRDSIDDWTVHEGGSWHVRDGEIVGRGDRNYNYLIKSEIPMHGFGFEFDILIERGTAGLILGNNYHGEYPYYYLIDVARDAVMLRRSYTATRIEPVKQAFADITPGRWVHLGVYLHGGRISIAVGGREVLDAPSDRDSYSLFGLYLFHARARFRKLLLVRDALPPAPSWARAGILVHPAGAAAVSSPRGPASPLATMRRATAR